MAFEQVTQESIAFANALLSAKKSVDSSIRWEAQSILQREKAHAKQMQLMSDEDKARLKGIEGEIRRQRYEDERNKAWADGVVKTVEGLKNFASGAMSASQSVYQSNQAYSAVIPTLDLLGQTFTSALSALSSFAQSIPFLGSFTEASNKILSVYANLSIQAAKIQIDNAQKFVDTYNMMSKSGVSFGGSLSMLANGAAKAGLSIDTYSKFIASSVHDLSTIGGGAASAAEQVAALGNRALSMDRSLLVLSGSYEEYNKQVAHFAASMVSAGVKVSKNFVGLEKPMAEYIRATKDLAELTGQSGESVRKEQEARRDNAAFLISTRDANKVREGRGLEIENTVSVISRALGPSLGKLMQDVVGAKGTGPLSEQGRLLAAQVPEVYGIFRQIYALSQNSQLTNAEFKLQSAQILQNNAGVIQQSVGKFEKFAVTQNAAGTGQDAFLDQSLKMVVEFTKAGNKLSTIADETKTQMAQTAQSQTDGITAQVAAVTEASQTVKRNIDQNMITSLGQVAENVLTLYKVNEKFVGLADKLSWGVDKMLALVDKIIEKAGDEGAPTSRGPNRSSPIVGPVEQNLRTQQAAFDQRFPIESEDEQGRTQRRGQGTPEFQQQQQELDRLRAQVREEQNQRRRAEEALRAAGRRSDAPAGVNVNPGANSGGITQGMYSVLEGLSRIRPGTQITALNDPDRTPQHATGAHGAGKGADISVEGMTEEQVKSLVAQIRDIKNEQGIQLVSKAFAETKMDDEEWARSTGAERTRGATGRHIHVESRLAKGGVTNGPSLAGEDGPEAVIPLPDGRQIPIQIDLSALVAKMEELISVAKDQADIAQKHLYAVA